MDFTKLKAQFIEHAIFTMKSIFPTQQPTSITTYAGRPHSSNFPGKRFHNFISVVDEETLLIEETQQPIRSIISSSERCSSSSSSSSTHMIPNTTLQNETMLLTDGVNSFSNSCHRGASPQYSCQTSIRDPPKSKNARALSFPALHVKTESVRQEFQGLTIQGDQWPDEEDTPTKQSPKRRSEEPLANPPLLKRSSLDADEEEELENNIDNNSDNRLMFSSPQEYSLSGSDLEDTNQQEVFCPGNRNFLRALPTSNGNGSGGGFSVFRYKNNQQGFHHGLEVQGAYRGFHPAADSDNENICAGNNRGFLRVPRAPIQGTSNYRGFHPTPDSDDEIVVPNPGNTRGALHALPTNENGNNIRIDGEGGGGRRFLSGSLEEVFFNNNDRDEFSLNEEEPIHLSSPSSSETSLSPSPYAINTITTWPPPPLAMPARANEVHAENLLCLSIMTPPVFPLTGNSLLISTLNIKEKEEFDLMTLRQQHFIMLPILKKNKTQSRCPNTPKMGSIGTRMCGGLGAICDVCGVQLTFCSICGQWISTKNGNRHFAKPKKVSNTSNHLEIQTKKKKNKKKNTALCFQPIKPRRRFSFRAPPPPPPPPPLPHPLLSS